MDNGDPPVCRCCGQVIRPAPKYRHWTAEDDARLKAMVANGLSNATIARSLKRPNSSIRSRLLTLAGKGKPIVRAEVDSIDEGEDDAEPVSSVVVRPGVRIISHRLR